MKYTIIFFKYVCIQKNDKICRNFVWYLYLCYSSLRIYNLLSNILENCIKYANAISIESYYKYLLRNTNHSRFGDNEFVKMIIRTNNNLRLLNVYVH